MKRLVLLGGGHAHLHVVQAFGARPRDGTQVTLIDRERHFFYSGMLPGLVAGHYRTAECRIDLAALCGRCGIEFVQQEAVALDIERRTVATASGGACSYDLLSVDTGSTPPLDRLPGARAHALAVKPLGAFVQQLERRLEELEGDPAPAIAVIGGGAGGFELALALEHHLRAGRAPAYGSVHLIADTPTLLPGLPSGARRLAERRLREQGIVCHTADGVRAIMAEALELASGRRVPVRLALLVTGAQASPLYRAAGLATDAGGFIRVAASLQSLSDPRVFACGDAASFAPRPLPKSGVHAVRQGPLLARNLRRCLDGAPLGPFTPQRNVLVLLSTGRRHAIAVRNGLSLHGRWVWRWKDRIDRGFLARYRTDS